MLPVSPKLAAVTELAPAVPFMRSATLSSPTHCPMTMTSMITMLATSRGAGRRKRADMAATAKTTNTMEITKAPLPIRERVSTSAITITMSARRTSIFGDITKDADAANASNQLSSGSGAQKCARSRQIKP